MPLYQWWVIAALSGWHGRQFLSGSAAPPATPTKYQCQRKIFSWARGFRLLDPDAHQTATTNQYTAFEPRGGILMTMGTAERRDGVRTRDSRGDRRSFPEYKTLHSGMICPVTV
jgi:hypothetical protein